MKRIMERTLLLGCVVIALGAGIATAGESKQDVHDTKGSDFWNSIAKETRLAGTLSDGASWLVLDQPIYFAKGSRSERVVRKVKMITPENLQKKIPAIEHRHVVVNGPMECAMEYSPWTASCELTIKHVEEIK